MFCHNIGYIEQFKVLCDLYEWECMLKEELAQGYFYNPFWKGNLYFAAMKVSSRSVNWSVVFMSEAGRC
jgi:hypothetical protein